MKNLDMKAVAQRIGCSKGHVSKLINGRVKGTPHSLRAPLVCRLQPRGQCDSPGGVAIAHDGATEHDALSTRRPLSTVAVTPPR